MDIFEQIAQWVDRAGVRAFLVGGTVRDMLMGRALHDVDFTVADRATLLARALANELGGAFYVMDAEHDVARVILRAPEGKLNVDFARQRGETILQDLATRDFSWNAMALPLDKGIWPASPESLVDPFGGRQDLEGRRVRAIGDRVFQDDPVRMMRAARLAFSLDFEIEPETEARIRRDLPELARGSVERLRDELFKILALSAVEMHLHSLDRLGLLTALLPELEAARGMAQSMPHTRDVFTHSLRTVGALEELERADYVPVTGGPYAQAIQVHAHREISSEHSSELLLRLTALLHDLGKPAARAIEEDGRIRYLGHEVRGAEMAEAILLRLRLSNEEIRFVRTVIAEHLRPIQLDQLPTLSNRARYRFFRDAGELGIESCVHAWADQRATFGEPFAAEHLQGTLRRLVSSYFDEYSAVVEPPRLLTGKEIMRHSGLGPGPEVGRLIEALREAQVEGQVKTREQALSWLTRHLFDKRTQID